MKKFPKKVILSVTKEDISNGIAMSYYNCAITKSATRRFSKLLGCKANCSTGTIIGVYTDDISEMGKYTLNDKAQDFITKFDTDKTKCKPCRLTLTKRK